MTAETYIWVTKTKTMKILILQGHPNKDSFVHALSQKYAEGARAKGHDVELINLIDLKFDPVLHQGYHQSPPQELEADLQMMQEKIKDCDHFVVAFPMWWASLPSLLKAFFERTFLPGYAFQYSDKLPIKLLKGRSARYIMTMDSPAFYYRLFLGAPGFTIIKKSILQFCGFSPVKRTVFYGVRKASDKKRKDWLEKVRILGNNE